MCAELWLSDQRCSRRNFEIVFKFQTERHRIIKAYDGK